MHENRETSEMPETDYRDRPAGEGKSRTARVYVFEESDSGTVPMNHSNKSGRLLAESEEGRPLIKGTLINPARSRHRARLACPRA